MTNKEIIPEENKILKCDITSDYFNKNVNSAKSFKIAIDAMSKYSKSCENVLKKIKDDYSSIDKKYLEKLPFNYLDRIEKVKSGIETNQNFLNKITSIYKKLYDSIKGNIKDENNQSSEEEVLNTIKISLRRLIIRDWSSKSKEEREINYMEVIKELKNYFNYIDKKDDMKNVKILIPGSGCSRLGLEIAKLGFDTELNEVDWVYIMVCDYLFNYSEKNELEYCPRILTFISSYSEESVYQKHPIPDVNIKEELKAIKDPKIKLIKGEFVQNYKDKKDIFDCIITVCFISSAENIIQFVEIISNLLKKGGVWINLGGLDYYYSGYSNSIDLTWDELRHVILQYQFDFKREEIKYIPYGKLEGCSLPYEYGAISFTCVKK